MQKYLHGKRYMMARRSVKIGRDNKRVRKINRMLFVVFPRFIRFLKDRLPKGIEAMASALTNAAKRLSDIQNITKEQ